MFIEINRAGSSADAGCCRAADLANRAADLANVQYVYRH